MIEFIVGILVGVALEALVLNVRWTPRKPDYNGRDGNGYQPVSDGLGSPPSEDSTGMCEPSLIIPLPRPGRAK